MGNYRFKLSNVTPLAWIYKLKEMGRPKNSSNTTPHQPNNEKQPKTKAISESPQPKPPCYNFTTSEEDFVLVSPAAIDHKTKFSSPPTITHQSSLKENSFLPPAEPPRKSSKTRHPSKTEFHRKFSAPCACKCYCHAPTSRPESPPEHFSPFPPDPNSVIGSYTKGASCLHATTKLKMHAKEETSLGHFHKHLPRISAKPAKFVQIGKKIIAQENNCRTQASMRTPGVGAKIRLSSPRTGGRKIQMVSCRKSMGSVAIAKETCDPYRDFMESMMAMIVEYKIRAPGDLEDLLVRYLSLNSNEYHEIIVKVFKQIWILLNDA